MQSYYSNPQQLQAAAAAIGLGAGGPGAAAAHHRMQYLAAGGGGGGPQFGPMTGQCPVTSASGPGPNAGLTTSAQLKSSAGKDAGKVSVDGESGDERMNSSSSADEHRDEYEQDDVKSTLHARRQPTPSSNGEVVQLGKQTVDAPSDQQFRHGRSDPDEDMSDIDGCSDDSQTKRAAAVASRGGCGQDEDQDDDYDDLDLDDDVDDEDLVDDTESVTEINGDVTDNVVGGGQETRDDVIASQRRRRRRRRALAKLRMKQERELIERELKAAAVAASSAAARRASSTAAVNMTLVDGRRQTSRSSPHRSDEDEDRALDFGLKKRRRSSGSGGSSGSGFDDNGLVSRARRGGSGGGDGGDGYSCGSDDDGSPSSPIEQTEIKMQRPLGLLAQHGLSVKMGGQMQQHQHGVGAAGGIRPHHLHHAGGPLMPGQFHHFDRAPTDFEREMLQQAMQAHGAAVSLHHAAAAAAAAAADKDGRLFGLGVPTPGMRVDFGNGPPMTPVSGTAPLSLMDRRFMPSPPPNGSTTPHGCGGQDPNKMTSNGSGSPGAHHWTFEEQFKQLYEMSNDPKRKEFLDDLFSFMQKRGTPVNRIPIMAKQTLDLYELFRLVVSKGGLVEVINKKLWREITKGLNLPSSITSAAFTLRTQYMKYLYPYECEKLKLSSLGELQSAIDGNRREGRRPGYGYDFSPLPPPPVGMMNSGHLGPPSGPMGQLQMSAGPQGSSMPPHLNGAALHPSLVAAAAAVSAASRPGSGLSAKDDECAMNMPMLSSAGGTTHGHLRSLAEHDARAMEAATRAMEEVSKRMEEASRAAAAMATGVMVTGCGNQQSHQQQLQQQANKYGDVTITSQACKRPALFDEEQRFLAQIGVPTTHLKMTSHNNGGRLDYENNSMVVSMEINGLMYQGVLFAQHAHRI